MYYKSLEDIKQSELIANYDSDSELMIYVAEESADKLDEMMSWLNDKGVKYFGGIYPKLIAGAGMKEKGFIIKGLRPIYSEVARPFLMKRLPNLEADKSYTGIIITDGLSDKIDELIETVNLNNIRNLNITGGCCGRYATDEYGTYSLENKASIFDNNGLHRDILRLCIIEEVSQSNVFFGWEVMDGPYRITSMKEKYICGIDNENPLELYQYAISQSAKLFISHDNFFAYATSYPFATLENGHIKNLIIPTEASTEGYFKLLHREISEEEEIYIVKADLDSFIHEFDKNIKDNGIASSELTVFSCFTREVLLQEQYDKEINYINKKYHMDAEGVLSFGEMTNKNDKMELRMLAGACVLVLSR